MGAAGAGLRGAWRLFVAAATGVALAAALALVSGSLGCRAAGSY